MQTRSVLEKLVFECFARRPDIVLDLLQRQADYDQAQDLMAYTDQALSELDAALVEIDQTEFGEGVNPKMRIDRIGRQKAQLTEFRAKLEKIEPPQDGFIVHEILRAVEQG